MNLNQVTIPSKDVKKAIEFYEKLGLELIVHTHDHYARFLCPKGMPHSLYTTEKS
jgi:catechol 2,3-dioxygenase-like lactoylglutathione lyase family enzyme